MNLKFYPLRAMLFFLMLFSIKSGVQAQLTFFKTVENFTTGGDGTTAEQGDELIYTMYITNTSTQNYIACRLYDNVPAGVSYIAGSTRMNGTLVTDKTGAVMPFSGNGSPVRSPSYGAGILAPNSQCIITFRVRVSANGGSIFNNATIDATQNSVSTIQATNTVFTNIDEDAGCNKVYETTTYNADYTSAGNTTSQREWSWLRELDINNGTSGANNTAIYNGPTGQRFEALPVGSTTTIAAQLLDNCAAIAYDRTKQRIYFVNNDVDQRLSYIDMSNPSNIVARRYSSVTFVPYNSDNSYRVNRMGMGSDGFLYALTANGERLYRISFNASDVPTITNLGALTNHATNGNKRILDEEGGDLFADGSGKLYLICNSSNMYKINPNTRVATYMGRVTFMGGPSATEMTSQSIAITTEGTVYIGGQYRSVWRLDLETMQATRINSGTNNVYVSGDYTTCGFPVLASSIIADKTYRNINGSPVVNGGDTVEYVITVTNLGNINAAGVYMYDYIPPSTIYLPGTTRMNGIPVPDVGGVMPFAVSGGRLVNSPGQDPGIVLPLGVNSAVVTFRVETEPNKQVCNQSRISLLDADGNVMFVNSSDPTNIGQTPTCFYSDGVLPLVNLKFKGSLAGEKSVLNWTMNGDAAVNYYEVEYSENGSAFTTTGKVIAKTNANSANSYTYTDNEHTFSTTRYYRLKVIQKDGNSSYSGIVRLNVKDLDIEAVPNPFDRDINVQVKLKTAETVRIRLLDFYGREVYSTVEQLSIGSHSIAIRIPAGLAKGIYVLDVRSGSEQIYQQKMIKK
ncbi:T9SS type A sorting domain-containing protein [Longitalea arenae]|uniref:T9SS type A sorting domain-containing protein n=1 Tax=Longitalea arenae TaxID=2812558 RepID=UPI0019680860|nr:T9SS type A sorting domain-containing protein [Longitalea arenae]